MTRPAKPAWCSRAAIRIRVQSSAVLSSIDLKLARAPRAGFIVQSSRVSALYNPYRQDNPPSIRCELASTTICSPVMLREEWLARNTAKAAVSSAFEAIRSGLPSITRFRVASACSGGEAQVEPWGVDVAGADRIHTDLESKRAGEGLCHR